VWLDGVSGAAYKPTMNRRFVSSVLTAMLLSLVVACQSNTPTPTSTPDEVAAPNDVAPGGAALSGETEQASDSSARRRVSAVKAPGEVLVHVRWKSPGTTLSTAARFTQFPPSFIEASLRQGIAEAVRELLGARVDAKKFADVVDIDAPFDLIVMLDLSSGPVPEPMMAMSLGLTSLSAARAAAKGRPAKIAEGVWRLGPQPKPWESHCAIAVAAGRTPARLVCADSEGELKRLASFMARTVPGYPDPKSDLRIELRLRPIFDKYGSQWARQARGLPVLAEEFKNGNPRFDSALMEAAAALADEAGALVHDADSMVIDASLDTSRGAELRFAVRFVGDRSWTVQSMLDMGRNAGPAPDMFWLLPKSSETLSYGRVGNVSRMDPMLKVLRGLLVGSLEEEKFGTAADRSAIAKLLRLPLQSDAAVVLANGHFSSAPVAASQAGVADMMSAAYGWQLVGVEQSPASLRAWLNDAVRVYNRRSLQKIVKKELRGDAKHTPKVRVVPTSPKLGGGGLTVEIRVPQLIDSSGPMGSTTTKGADLRGYVMLMADGKRSWVGAGLDKKGLIDVMKSVKGATPGPGSVSSRSGLAQLKRERHATVFVTSIEGLINAMKPGMATMMLGRQGASGPMNQIMRAIAGMPHHGQSPILMVGDVNTGAKPSYSGSMRMSRESLIDLGHLITQGIKATF
jgi:hypothetical protein